MNNKMKISALCLGLTAAQAGVTQAASMRGYDIDVSVDGGAYTDLAVVNNRGAGLELNSIDLTGITGVVMCHYDERRDRKNVS